VPFTNLFQMNSALRNSDWNLSKLTTRNSWIFLFLFAIQICYGQLPKSSNLIGSYSFSALGTIITKDVPAYVRVSGNPAIPRGLNTVGIQRQGLSKEVSEALKESYKILYLRKNKFNEAKKEIISRFQDIKEMDLFIKSISNSERSIVR